MTHYETYRRAFSALVMLAVSLPLEAQSPATRLDGTSLFAALDEQLGLRLQAQRAPVNVIVIESVERPAQD